MRATGIVTHNLLKTPILFMEFNNDAILKLVVTLYHLALIDILAPHPRVPQFVKEILVDFGSEILQPGALFQYERSSAVRALTRRLSIDPYDV